MKYSIDIKLGAIGFSGGRNWVQRCICFFINSQFSHSFIVIEGPFKNLSAFETTETRVCLTPVDRKLEEKNYVEIWDVNASVESKIEAQEFSYSMFSGELYGYLSYLWFIYRWFFRLFKIEKTKMWEWASKGVTCSELTASYLDFLFPELFSNIDINTISPKELYSIVKKNPDKFSRVGWLKNE